MSGTPTTTARTGAPTGPPGRDCYARKSDQTGEGHEIVIPRGLRIRPVEAVQAWLQAAGVSEGLLLFYTTKADGLGLGLSICRSIIDAHVGKLWATPGVPQDAVFQFTLPGA
jgi:hypothetical protein